MYQARSNVVAVTDSFGFVAELCAEYLLYTAVSLKLRTTIIILSN